VRYDARLLLLSLASALPAAVVALVLLWIGDYTPRVQWTLGVLIVATWIVCAVALRNRVILPLQTIANLLAALRERDFSVRARADVRAVAQDDALAAVMLEVNELASTLHDQRLGALEAGALLRTVMLEIDVAVFTFDAGQTLRLVNRAGERLLGLTSADLLGRTAGDLQLASCLDGTTPRVEEVAFPGGRGRWEVRRTTFRQDGRPHQLLVLSDVSRPLRDEERQAWQRLIRVIGHEINNSLAPIKSIAGSLEAMVSRSPATAAGWPAELTDDMTRGLAVIAARAESLSRFTLGYAQLAKLPAPQLQAVRIGDVIARAAAVASRQPVRLEGDSLLVCRADPDQLEQLLINVLRNAAEAAAQTGGGVSAGWGRDDTSIVVWIDDEGAGLTNRSNLFVPFFTTKPTGTGIGLVLSRQIAEAHGGTLTLDNRTDRTGCRATLRIPI
jgi:two-component system nitrogen regulation sensor histidine kinase NtrY